MKLISKNINSRAIQVLLLVLTCNVMFSQKFKVTLDAGHGDHDFGAVYNGHIEKNINLALVLKVGKILESTPNFEVFYTRKTDVFIGLIERANIANRADSNIFVSIHCNANVNTVADGTETYVMGMSKNASNLEAAKKENSVITLEKDYKNKYEGFNPNNPESMLGITMMQEEFIENSIVMAGKIQDKFVGIGRRSRGGGVKQAPYMVLHKAYMPRVLIETGFISNPVEGQFLDSEEGQLAIANSIAEAIISYKKDYFDGGEYIEPSEKPSDRVEDTTTPSPTDQPKSTENTTNEAENGIIFKVQLSASPNKVALISSNFKGLQNVTSTFDTKIYKYIYGATANYEEANKLLKEAKSKGYTTAFIIAFKNGKSINLKEVIK